MRCNGHTDATCCDCSQSFYYFVFLKLHLMHVTSAEMKGGVCASVLISQSYMF